MDMLPSSGIGLKNKSGHTYSDNDWTYLGLSLSMTLSMLEMLICFYYTVMRAEPELHEGGPGEYITGKRTYMKTR